MSRDMFSSPEIGRFGGAPPPFNGAPTVQLSYQHFIQQTIPVTTTAVVQPFKNDQPCTAIFVFNNVSSAGQVFVDLGLPPNIAGSTLNGLPLAPGQGFSVEIASEQSIWKAIYFWLFPLKRFTLNAKDLMLVGTGLTNSVHLWLAVAEELD